MAKRFIDGIRLSAGKIEEVQVRGKPATEVVGSGNVGEIVDSGAFTYSIAANGGNAWRDTGSSFTLPEGKWLILIAFTAPVASSNHYRCGLSTTSGNNASNLLNLAPNNQLNAERINYSTLGNTLVVTSLHYYENDGSRTVYWKFFREENTSAAESYVCRFLCIRIA